MLILCGLYERGYQSSEKNFSGCDLGKEKGPVSWGPGLLFFTTKYECDRFGELICKSFPQIGEKVAGGIGGASGKQKQVLRLTPQAEENACHPSEHKSLAGDPGSGPVRSG
jgi:hypothetical protein